MENRTIILLATLLSIRLLDLLGVQVYLGWEVLDNNSKQAKLIHIGIQELIPRQIKHSTSMEI